MTQIKGLEIIMSYMKNTLKWINILGSADSMISED